MPCSWHGKQFRAGCDEFQRILHLSQGAKSIASAMHEEGRRIQAREVCRAQLIRSARRVERVGEQKKPLHQARFACREHRRLPPAVRMAAEINAACRHPAHAGDCASQSLLIAFGASSRRRPRGSRLPERQIASQHGDTRRAERIPQSHQKWRATVRAGAMRQHESVSTGIRCGVQETSHRHVFRRHLQEFSDISHGHPPRGLTIRFHSAPGGSLPLSSAIRPH